MSDALVQTTAIQRQVADPHRSAWVSANAGTGKTYVLVRRVIRQLLAGASPQSILCITFTKAAAAEMSTRLLGMLSQWSLMSDDDLSQEIAEVTGEHPTSDERERARRLFALALETPGGLKIQTIHSFCSSILARFPAEASLPLGFRPLEDDQAAALLQRCVAQTAEAFTVHEGLSEHFMRIAERFEGQEGSGPHSVMSIEKIVYDYASRARQVDLHDSGSVVGRLAEAVGADPTDSDAALIDRFLGEVDQQFLRQVITVFRTGKATDQKLAEGLQTMLEHPLAENIFEAPPIFTQSGTMPKVKGKVRHQIEGFEDKWQDFADHLKGVRDRWLALQALNDNVSLLIVSQAVLRSYAAAKEREAALDYEDLILRTLALLRNVDASWVRFKLDQGVDHILIDEAQDNSSAQWDVFRQLAEEIVATDGEAAGADRLRSIFVVGDPKQSIYAFQGAEAALFNRTKDDYREQLTEDLSVAELFLSFRTAQPILDVVDAVFDREAFTSVSGAFPRHASKHDERAGSVTLWPDVPEAEKVQRSAFETAVDEVADDSVDYRIAQALAEDIDARLAEAAPLACKEGRPMAAHDVLVLFQRRGPRFRTFLRALSERGIPCAGSDRVGLKDDQAVQDLLSVLRFAANTDDSLALAELLKSPFLGWSEEELFDLCSEREQSVLWRELKARAEDQGALAERCGSAQAHLQRVIDAGARHGPYALLTAVLETGLEKPGRRALAERLGPDYREAVDAFLDHALAFEEQEPRSVQGFLARAEQLRADVKRELQGQSGGGVRVMTVHGSKGLEAPIVYLGDADYLKAPHHQFRSNPLAMAAGQQDDGLLPIVLPGSVGNDSERLAALRADEVDRRHEEYQRLLYVAMTRAEEHLVVCGGKEGKRVANWCHLVRTGLNRLSAEEGFVADGDAETGQIRFAKVGETSASAATVQERSADLVAPVWLEAQAVAEAANPVIYPSLHDVDPDEPGGVLKPVGASSVDARRRGVLMHRLLELLPAVAEQARRDAAERLVDAARASLGDAECASIVQSALQFIADPRYKDLFGETGRGEVSVQGELDGVTVSGEIDRLAVFDDRVVLAEFKSTRWIPATADDIPKAHRAQTQIYKRLVELVYPGRAVEAQLIYVAAPRAFLID